MIHRVGQTWEIVSFMNGERVFVVLSSREVPTSYGDRATVHEVLQVTGKKLGRVLVYTELDKVSWEEQLNMTRLA